MTHRIIWLTGHSGSGKTTLAKQLIKHITAINLDGDEMRECISLGLSLSIEDRRMHNYKVALLAGKLSNQMSVIVSVIAPIEDVRNVISESIHPIWIHLDKPSLGIREGHFYEKSERYDLELNTDMLTIDECIDKILRLIIQ